MNFKACAVSPSSSRLIETRVVFESLKLLTKIMSTLRLIETRVVFELQMMGSISEFENGLIETRVVFESHTPVLWTFLPVD